MKPWLNEQQQTTARRLRQQRGTHATLYLPSVPDTRREGGPGGDVSFPDLPGRFVSGDVHPDLAFMAADAAMTWAAAKMAHGKEVPKP